MPFLCFDAVCVGSPVIIIYFTKNKYIKKWNFQLEYNKGHSTLIKSTETSWSSARYLNHSKTIRSVIYIYMPEADPGAGKGRGTNRLS